MTEGKKQFSDLIPFAQATIYKYVGYVISGIPSAIDVTQRKGILVEMKRTLEKAGMASEDFEPIRAFSKQHFKKTNNDENIK